MKNRSNGCVHNDKFRNNVQHVRQKLTMTDIQSAHVGHHARQRKKNYLQLERKNLKMKIKSGTNLTLTLNVMFFYHDLLFVAMIVIFL